MFFFNIQLYVSGKVKSKNTNNKERKYISIANNDTKPNVLVTTKKEIQTNKNIGKLEVAKTPAKLNKTPKKIVNNQTNTNKLQESDNKQKPQEKPDLLEVMINDQSKAPSEDINNILIGINEVIQHIFNIIPKTIKTDDLNDAFKTFNANTNDIFNKKQINVDNIKIIYDELKKVELKIVEFFQIHDSNKFNEQINELKHRIDVLEDYNKQSNKSDVFQLNSISAQKTQLIDNTQTTIKEIDLLKKQIQEQQKIIQTLTENINSLKSEYSELKKNINTQNIAIVDIQKNINISDNSINELKNKIRFSQNIPIKHFSDRLKILESDMEMIRKVLASFNSDYLGELQNQIKKVFFILGELQKINVKNTGDTNNSDDNINKNE